MMAGDNRVTHVQVRLIPPNSRQLPLLLALSVLPSGAVRVHIDEDPDLLLSSLEHADPSVSMPEAWDAEMDGEWDPPRVTLGRAVKTRFEPAQSFASIDVLESIQQCEFRAPSAFEHRLRCIVEPAGEAAGHLVDDVVEVRLLHSPLSIEVLDREGEEMAVLNGRGRLFFDPFRQATPSEMAQATPTEPNTFNSFTDAMQYGSSSVGLDIDFPLATHVYGLPERTVRLVLPFHLGPPLHLGLPLGFVANCSANCLGLLMC